MTEQIIPRHQWTHDGKEVLVVRFVNADGTSSTQRRIDNQSVETNEPFKHPLIVGEKVTALDWDPSSCCGGGIHGWPWAFSLGEGKECDWSAVWLVYGVKPEDVVEVEGKVKFKSGILRFSGTWHGAMMFVLSGQMAWVRHASSGAATASGYSGAATASGDRGAATAKDKALSAVVTGILGKARAPEHGCIALAWFNEKEQRIEMRCALIGKGRNRLKPDTWYLLDKTGKFVEAK